MVKIRRGENSVQLELAAAFSIWISKGLCPFTRSALPLGVSFSVALPPLPTPPPSLDTHSKRQRGAPPSQGTSLGSPCSSSRPWTLPCSAAVTWLFSRSLSAAPASPPQSNDAIAAVSALAPGTCCHPRAGQRRLGSVANGWAPGPASASRPPAARSSAQARAQRGAGGGRARCGAQPCGAPASFPFGQPAIARLRETGHQGGAHTALQALVLVPTRTAPPGHQRCEIAQNSGGTDGLDWRFGKKAEFKCRHLSQSWVFLMYPHTHAF